MNRIAGRASAVLLLTAALLTGLVFFLCEYFVEAENWAIFSGSPHIYDSQTGRLDNYYATDRDGILLLDLRDGHSFAPDVLVRKAALHWTGDREGNVSVPFYAHYTEELAGFDILNGIYAYGNPGANIRLTLSSRIQAVALEAMGGFKGTVAVMNYETGEILCAVSTPAFDPEAAPEITKENEEQWEGVYLNRFTQTCYVPGSIFKIVTAAAALEELPGIEEMTFTCAGSYEFGVDKVTCEAVHGTQDIKAAFAHSCNCAFAQIALLLGQEKLDKYVRQFGITESVSFDGITTAQGSVALENTADVELAWSAIGQHKDQINPCRYLTFLAAIARDGVEVTPHVIEEISIGTQKTYSAGEGREKRIMSVTTAKTLQEYMLNNVRTIYGADKFQGFTAGGKSGTAEVGGGLKPNALFTGFLQDKEYPLVFIAVAENGGYGSTTCIPILSKILAACREELRG